MTASAVCGREYRGCHPEPINKPRINPERLRAESDDLDVVQRSSSPSQAQMTHFPRRSPPSPPLVRQSARLTDEVDPVFVAERFGLVALARSDPRRGTSRRP